MSPKTISVSGEASDTDYTYSVIFENALEGIAITDSTNMFIDVNPSCCKMLGYDRTELLQLSIFDVFVKDEIESMKHVFDELLSTKLDFVEKKILRKDGLSKHVELNVKKLPDGRFLYFIFEMSVSKIHKEKHQLTEQEIQNIICNFPFGSHHYELQAGNRLVFMGANPAADEILG
ncbi:MAG: PAS domain S-box protein, partial [bacterium]|nr:PAS domain S-box protein [bacterium]